MNPTFSIIIPTYNRPAMLRRALKSVAAQTYKDFEVIVIDDCSPVPTELPSDLGIAHLQLIRHEKNKGPAAAYNTGIASAKGQFISILDDDDEYHPDFLTRTAQAFHSHPEGDWCWTSIKVIDYGVTGSSSQPEESIFPEKYENDADLFFDAISIGNGFGFTVRAACYRNLGAYDESFKVAEDAEFIYRLLANGARPIVIPDQLVTVHNHEQDRMTALGNDEGRFKDCERIIEIYGDFIRKYPKIEKRLRLHMDSMKS